jgi:hypothetical protein
MHQRVMPEPRFSYKYEILDRRRSRRPATPSGR